MRATPTLVLVAGLGCSDGDRPVDLPHAIAPTVPSERCVPTCAPGTVCTVMGFGTPMLGNLVGDPLEIGLYWPYAALLDADRCLVVADNNNNLVRRIDPDGVSRNIVGNGLHTYAVDGAFATEAGISAPTDAAYADDGTLFLFEQHAARILTVDPTGWLTVYAGDPVNPGYDRCDPDGVPAREGGMTQGWGLTLGDDGTLYFAEPLVDRIRKVTPDGILHSVAGACVTVSEGLADLDHAGAGFVDGVGGDARFSAPYDVKFHDGWLYVADTGNHAIRRIDPATNEVTTLYGTGVRGFSGDGGLASDAEFAGPIGMDFDPAGALYVADAGNNVIRRIDPDGTISTIMGRAPPAALGYSGDGGPPADARLAWPTDVLVLPNGDLVVVDTHNARVRIATGMAAAAE